jgi:hypothetical protein
MTQTVKLNLQADRTLELVKALRAEGYVQGIDFDFAFYRSTWDPMTGNMEGHTNFTFYNDHAAFLFQLKYSGG